MKMIHAANNGGRDGWKEEARGEDMLGSAEAEEERDGEEK